jgi:dipeptidyl aminopeptidase/acylaminoacyl peptidase
MLRFIRLVILACMAIGAARTAGATPPPVEVYGKLPKMSDVRLSPSGQHLAFVADDGNGRRLFVSTTDGHPLESVAFGDKKLLDVQWAGDDYVLVQISATVDISQAWLVPKAELSGVIVIDLVNKKISQVFRGHDNVNPEILGTYGVRRIGDSWFGFFGGTTIANVYKEYGAKDFANISRDGNFFIVNTDLYRVDLATGELHLAAKGELGSGGWLVGPDGEIVARALYNEKSGAWRVMTGASGGRQLASGTSPLAGVDILGLGRNGDSLLIWHANNDERVTEETPLSGGPARTVQEDESTGLIFDRVTDRWIGEVLDLDEPDYKLFSAQAAARVRGARNAFPGYRTHLVSWSDDFGRMVIFTDGKDDSGTYWMVDIAAGKATVLGAAYPTVTPDDVGPVRMIDYKAADGLALRGVLTLPPGREPKNLPLVVMPHGGPWARDHPGFNYWAQAFASRGYAVFQPNFRGSDGYGAALRDAGMGQWGGKMQTDISDGAAELAREGIVDPKRACIVGWSYGGYAALAGVTVQSGLYRCAVSMAGVSDLGRMMTFIGDETGAVSTSTRYWNAFLGDRSRWRDISPASLAARADAPILLIHGKDDTVVPILQSDIMERALRSAGKSVERLTLTGADHWLLKEETRVEMLKASVAFVEKYNPSDPAAPQSAPPTP